MRVTRAGAPEFTHEQQVRGRVAAREIRLGVEWHDAAILRVAQGIHLALHGFELDPPSLLDGTSQAQPVLERLVERVEEAFESGRVRVVEGAMPLLEIPPEFELAVRDSPPPIDVPLPPIARPVPPDLRR